MSKTDEEGQQERPRILIVDDHDGVRRLLRSWLEDVFPGDRVMDVASGEEAVVLVASHPLDLVLMDIQLPEMSGFEAARRIKAISPQTRVVMLTSLDDMATRLAASAAGASAFVAKHAMYTDLVPTLGALLHAPVE